MWPHFIPVAFAFIEGQNMTKKEYLRLILSLLRPDEIKLSAANPTQYMTKTQVLLHYVALRRLGVYQ